MAHHLGLTRFVPLTRNGVSIPGSVTVDRISKGDIPDWIAWDPRQSRFALCEAKGSLCAKDFLDASGPKCVRDGKKQFDRVQVRLETRAIIPDRWVGATRWSTDYRQVDPITILWDPPGDGQDFTPAESIKHQRAISTVWLDSLAPGFGLRDAAELLSPERRSSGVVIRAEPGPRKDWPSDETELIPGVLEALRDDQAQRSILQESTKSMVLPAATGNELALTSAYAARPELLAPPLRATYPHEAAYTIAIATRFGIRPIRSRSEFESLKREQERALRLEEPAMLIGLPLDLKLEAEPSRTVWMDGAGVAPANDLALFDIRQVTADLL